MRNKKQTTVYLEPDQAEALAELSRATRVPQAIFIRDGVEIVIRKAREMGTIPGKQISAQDAADAMRILDEQGVRPCNCGAMPGPHHHMDKVKA